MNNQTIPGTHLQVSPLCLGTMTFGTPVGEAEAVRLMHQALDRGVNFIDTANAYEGYTRFVGSPGGITERIVGKALKGRREGNVVATKMGMKVGSGPEDEHCSPAAIRKQLDLSLRSAWNASIASIFITCTGRTRPPRCRTWSAPWPRRSRRARSCTTA